MKFYSLFNKWCWETWIFTCKMIKIELFIPLTKSNLKWIKHLNETQNNKIPETKQSKSSWYGLDIDFLFWYNLKSVSNTIKISKWDHIKLKSDCTAKDSQQIVEATYKMGGNICRPYIRKELYPKYIRNSYNSIAKTKTQIILFKNRQKTWIDIFQRRHKTAKKYMKRCSASLITGNENQNHSEILLHNC